MPQITFQICSWKAPESLKDTLRSIAIQPHPYLFETLLVNNGFSDEKAALLLKEFPAINLRIIREPTPGLAHARFAGFKNACGEVFVLLDDDNTLEETFVSELVGLLDTYPRTGGICPLILPKWEGVTPPSWVQDIGLMCLSYTAKDRSEARSETRYWPPEAALKAPRPPGGGMIIHRKTVERYMSHANDPLRRSLDRVGDQVAGCQDCDIYEQIRYTELGTLQTSRLVIYHQIPTSRCKLGYLLKLNYHISFFYIRHLDSYSKRPISPIREAVNLLKSLVKYVFLALTGRKHVLYCLCILVRRAGSFAARFSAPDSWP